MIENISPGLCSILLQLNGLVPFALMRLRHPALISDQFLLSSLQRHDESGHRTFIISLYEHVILSSLKKLRNIHPDWRIPIFRSGDFFTIDAEFKGIVTSDDQGSLGRLGLKRQSCFKVRLFACDGAGLPNPHGIGSKGLQAQKAQNGEVNQVMFHELFTTVILM